MTIQDLKNKLTRLHGKEQDLESAISSLKAVKPGTHYSDELERVLGDIYSDPINQFRNWVTSNITDLDAALLKLRTDLIKTRHVIASVEEKVKTTIDITELIGDVDANLSDNS